MNSITQEEHDKLDELENEYPANSIISLRRGFRRVMSIFGVRQFITDEAGLSKHEVVVNGIEREE